MKMQLVSVGPNTVGIKGQPRFNWTITKFTSIPGFVKAEEFEVKVVVLSENKPKTHFDRSFKDLRAAHDYRGFLESFICSNFMGYRPDMVIKVGCLVTRIVDGEEVIEYRIFEVGRIGSGN